MTTIETMTIEDDIRAQTVRYCEERDARYAVIDAWAGYIASVPRLHDPLEFDLITLALAHPPHRAWFPFPYSWWPAKRDPNAARLPPDASPWAGSRTGHEQDRVQVAIRASIEAERPPSPPPKPAKRPRQGKPPPQKPAVAPVTFKNGQRQPPPMSIQRWVLHRDRFRCVRCGFRSDDATLLHIHHVVEVAAGGQHDPDTMDVLCEPCHMEWTHIRPGLPYAEWKEAPALRVIENMIGRGLRQDVEGDEIRRKFFGCTLGEIVDTMIILRRQRLDEP